MVYTHTGAVTFAESSTSTPVQNRICFAVNNDDGDNDAVAYTVNTNNSFGSVGFCFTIYALANLDQYGNQFVHMDEPNELVIAYVQEYKINEPNPNRKWTVNDSISIETPQQHNDVSIKT